MSLGVFNCINGEEEITIDTGFEKHKANKLISVLASPEG